MDASKHETFQLHSGSIYWPFLVSSRYPAWHLFPRKKFTYTHSFSTLVGPPLFPEGTGVTKMTKREGQSEEQGTFDTKQIQTRCMGEAGAEGAYRKTCSKCIQFTYILIREWGALKWGLRIKRQVWQSLQAKNTSSHEDISIYLNCLMFLSPNIPYPLKVSNVSANCPKVAFVYFANKFF